MTLADAPRSADRVLPEDASPDDLVVHQQDVQAVVNALWPGGAEAMQIMDQRVITTSAVRCVGNTLILQGRVYSPPFQITAIGDPQRLPRRWTPRRASRCTATTPTPSVWSTGGGDDRRTAARLRRVARPPARAGAA